MKKFAPLFQITATESQLAVLFDSASAEDTTRSPKVVCVPRLHGGIAFELCAAEGAAFVLKLLVRNPAGNAETQVHELAVISLPARSADTLSQAIADAFFDALARYYQWEHELSGPVPASRYEPQYRAPRPVAANNSVFRGVKRATFACFLVVLTIGVVAAVMGVGPLAGHNMAPIQDAVAQNMAQNPASIQNAVAQNMAQDPAAIQAQVELTQQTLRQMGIDPGRPGDLGCLAPQ